MYVLGINTIEVDHAYLYSLPCEACNKADDLQLTINCKAFMLGSFLWQWKWFVWGKSGSLTCNYCKKNTPISDLNGETKIKAEAILEETKIPLKFYILPTILLAFILLFIYSEIFG